MTAQHPPDRQPAATERAVAFNSLLGVPGAAWIKTAVIAQQGADKKLIATDEQDQDGAHGPASLRQCRCNAVNRTTLLCSTTPILPITTQSSPPSDG